MGKPSLWHILRSWIGGIGWRVFLWSIGMTQDQYLTRIEENAIQRHYNCKCRAMKGRTG